MTSEFFLAPSPPALLTRTIVMHRHGETSVTARKGRYATMDDQFQTGLTAHGITEIEALGQALEDWSPFDLYVCSHFPRAVQSACIVQRYIASPPLTFDVRLCDHVAGETAAAVWNRLCLFVADLYSLPSNQILISSHGSIIHALCQILHGQRGEEFVYNVYPPTGGYAWVTFDEGVIVDACWSEIRHLHSLHNEVLR